LLKDLSIRNSGLSCSTDDFGTNSRWDYIESKLFDEPVEANRLCRRFRYGITKSHGKPLNCGLLGANLLSSIGYITIQKH
jgi:hypothetical protein